MKPRNAIVLSLGMLLEKVDTAEFIGKLLKKARTENSEFKFSPEIRDDTFGMAEQFNQGNITPEKFAAELPGLLGIEINSEDFWQFWNDIIQVGKIDESLALLQKKSQNNAVIYLYSDTNTVHHQKIADECKKLKISLVTDKQPMVLARFPLYPTYQLHKSRNEVIEEIVKIIHEKEFKVEKVTVFIGNPNNIKNKNHQIIASEEFDAMTAWGVKNNLLIRAHNSRSTLEETLNQAFEQSKTEQISEPSTLRIH